MSDGRHYNSPSSFSFFFPPSHSACLFLLKEGPVDREFGRWWCPTVYAPREIGRKCNSIPGKKRSQLVINNPSRDGTFHSFRKMKTWAFLLKSCNDGIADFSKIRFACEIKKNFSTLQIDLERYPSSQRGKIRFFSRVHDGMMKRITQVETAGGHFDV